MNEGTVKYYNPERGFGFIGGYDGTDAFFHVSDIPRDYIPERGDHVRYECRMAERGLRAFCIEVIETAEAA